MRIHKQLGKETVNTFSRKVKILAERMRGIDFSTVIQPEEIGFDPEKITHSSPSGNKYLTNLLDDLDVTERDSILDIGSGKGSAIQTMLKYPFSKVDGVELSNYLAVVATQNFKKLNMERTQIFNCDATSFKNFGNYNIFYLYNPFPYEIMVKVINSIYISVKDPNKEIRLIYNNPVCHDAIINQGFFSKTKEYPDEWGNKIYVYSNSLWRRNKNN
jgi:SAM-dependent methyltransferase